MDINSETITTTLYVFGDFMFLFAAIFSTLALFARLMVAAMNKEGTNFMGFVLFVTFIDTLYIFTHF